MILIPHQIKMKIPKVRIMLKAKEGQILDNLKRFLISIILQHVLETYKETKESSQKD